MATISITNELDVADKYEALDNPIDPNRSAFLEDPSLKTLVGDQQYRYGSAGKWIAGTDYF